jgi:23S rRNA (cytidine2498-2'-O)-methyltransferase
VQTRLFEDGWPYARYDVNKRLSEQLVEHGTVLNVRDPEQIISVVLTPALGFLGLSFAVDNLSDWAGGARHFRREEGQVSRAEFKLLEALELFALSLPAQGLALDLGAAPGGWTRILRKHAMRVVAVDPGDLDGRLATDGAIRHVRQTAQAYLRTSSERFNVILNDMRMDARASAQLTVAAARSLEPSGWALVTLKLPKRAASGAVASALSILRRRYDVIGARQLFHNRSEATVALRQVGSS